MIYFTSQSISPCCSCLSTY